MNNHSVMPAHFIDIYKIIQMPELDTSFMEKFQKDFLKKVVDEKDKVIRDALISAEVNPDDHEFLKLNLTAVTAEGDPFAPSCYSPIV
jgi:hypothetical protein